jgi:mono/diheme cytochrome c family protein
LWWDEQLAAETHELWERLCKECHHGSRKREKVLAYPPPPRDWARTPTRFFTWDHEPKVAFQIVMAGAKARPGEKDMPAWKDQLSREQVWGLIYFVNRVSLGKKSGLR